VTQWIYNQPMTWTYQALAAACDGLTQGSPADHAAPYRGEFWQHRNAYDGNGEYEFPTARHYVPQYRRG